MIEYFNRYMPVTGKKGISHSNDISEKTRENLRRAIKLSDDDHCFYSFSAEDRVKIDVEVKGGYYTAVFHKKIGAIDVPLLYTIGCSKEECRTPACKFIKNIYNSLKNNMPALFRKKKLEIPPVPFVVDILIPTPHLKLLDGWALDLSITLAWALLEERKPSTFNSINLNYESPILRESVEDIPGARKDDYEGLPEELKEFNYYIPDCGHSIMAIPECLIRIAQEDGDLYDYELPFPVKYVLEKGYKFVDGHVVCEGYYDSKRGLDIDEGYDEF